MSEAMVSERSVRRVVRAQQTLTYQAARMIVAVIDAAITANAEAHGSWIDPRIDFDEDSLAAVWAREGRELRIAVMRDGSTFLSKSWADSATPAEPYDHAAMPTLWAWLA